MSGGGPVWLAWWMACGVERAEDPPLEPLPSEAPTVPEGAQVQLSLLTADGRPAEACSGRLWLTPDPEAERAPLEAHEARCIRGILEWVGLPPGDYQLEVTGSELATHRASLELAQDQQLRLEPEILYPGGEVQVQVTSEGSPAYAAEVRGDPGSWQGFTDSEGVLLWRGVPEGSFSLEARRGSERASASIEVIAGSTAAVLLDLWELGPRPVLGLRFAKDPEGLLISSVQEGGPGDRGGLQRGDVILRAREQSLKGMEARRAAELLTRGRMEPSEYTVKRGEQIWTVTLTPVPYRSLLEESP